MGFTWVGVYRSLSTFLSDPDERVFLCQQAVDKVRQLRFRIVQRLNVPKRTPRFFARCGLACGMARLGAPGLGG
jgi:hypothetical protein